MSYRPEDREQEMPMRPRESELPIRPRESELPMPESGFARPPASELRPKELPIEHQLEPQREALNRFNQQTSGRTQLTHFNIVDDQDDDTDVLPPNTSSSGSARRPEVQPAAAATANTESNNDILSLLRENNALPRKPHANATKAVINTSFDGAIVSQLREMTALIRQPNANAMKASINTEAAMHAHNQETFNEEQAMPAQDAFNMAPELPPEFNDLD